MQRLFSSIADHPGGVTVKEFCSFCPNAKTGTLTFVEDGQTISLPVCLKCAGPELTAGIDHDTVDRPRKKVNHMYIGGGAVALVLIILLLILIF